MKKEKSKKRDKPKLTTPHVNSNKSNNAGIVSVVFGILSLLALGLGGMILGLIGLIFGMNQKKNNSNKWSSWGIWLNILGIVLGILVAYLLVNYLPDLLAQYQASLPAGGS
jgi:uncharacterized membrane protein YozB (DUF420 family)